MKRVVIKFTLIVQPIDVANRLFESTVNGFHEIQFINTDDSQDLVYIRNRGFTDADSGYIR